MALTATAPASHSRFATIPQTRENISLLKDAALARHNQKYYETEARAAEKTWKSLRDRIVALLGGRAAGICGKIMVTVSSGADVPGSVTLADGTKLPLSSITAFMVGNQHYDAKGATVYGGRSGSTSVEINGA